MDSTRKKQIKKKKNRTHSTMQGMLSLFSNNISLLIHIHYLNMSMYLERKKVVNLI